MPKALTVAPDTTLGLARESSNVHGGRRVRRAARRPLRTASRVDARLLLRKLAAVRHEVDQPGLVRSEQGATVQAASRRARAREPARRYGVPTAAAPQPSADVETAIGPVIVIRRGVEPPHALPRHDQYVRRFHVATGQAIYPTPLGRFQIVVKWKNP